MNSKMLLLLLILIQVGCVTNEESPFIPFVPDDTPLIVGILETTKDTIHYYPEVYVGKVSNIEGVEIEYSRVVEGIWWPIMSAQVAGSCTWMDLTRVPDEEAMVSISGPIDKPGYKKVKFTNEGNGVYGDSNYELEIVPDGTYQLDVVTGDGRVYSTKTTVPKLISWDVPDSIYIELEYRQLYDGSFHEKNKEFYDLAFNTKENIGYIVYQRNTEYDEEYLGVSNDELLFGDRSNFIREGLVYGIFDANIFPDRRAVEIVWSEGDKDSVKNSVQYWLSLYQLNDDLSKYFYVPFSFVSTPLESGVFEERSNAQNQAFVDRDTTYLFDISNIIKVSKKGGILPKVDSDAIGVFGAYSAGYRTTTVIPVRNWDPDSLNWGNSF